MKSDADEPEFVEPDLVYVATPPPPSTPKELPETVAYHPQSPDGGSIAVDAGSIGGYKETVRPASVGTAPPTESQEDRDWIRGIFKERGLWLEKELGRGTYGTVYLAKDKNEAKVAVKVFHTEYNGGGKFKEEVDRLAQAEGALGVIGLKSIHIDEERYPYFVMQYASGGSLAKYTEGDKPASISRVVRVFQRVVETIAYVHKEVAGKKDVVKPPIIHCDLKPRNILLNSVGEPLIADFGLARLQREAGQALGTPFYMPPEQAAGGSKPEPAWDIFALGAILFELVTGRPPHYDPELAKAIHTNPTAGLEAYRRRLLESPPPSDHWRGVDRRLAEIIDHCLQPDPARRMPDANELLRKLKRREEWLAHREIFVDFKASERGGTDNLAAYLAEYTAMPAKKAVPLFRQIVEAVQRAHGRGIRHQDLRPENIVFRKSDDEDGDSQPSSTFSPRPKAKPTESTRGSSRSLGMSRSHVYFTAPERARTASSQPPTRLVNHARDDADQDAGLDHPKFREDIYSLGVLLHTMLTGKPPRASEEFESRLKDEGDVRKWMLAYAEHVDANAALADLDRRDIDSELRTLLADCLSLDARKRPKSTSEVIERLDRRQHWRDNRGAFWKLVKIAAVLFVGVSVVGYLLGSKSVDDARTRRYEQTIQGHREFLFGAEQTLNKQVSNAIDSIEQMAMEFRSAKLADGRPAIDHLLRNRDLLATGDKEAVKRFQKATSGALLGWLQTYYPRHVFNGSDVQPFGIMAVARAPDKTYRGYIVGRVEAAPWSIGDGKRTYEERFVLPDSALGRNFSFRDYFHGKGRDLAKEIPADSVVRGTYISKVYRTTAMRDPQRPDGRDSVMEIVTPVYAEGDASGDPVALLASSVFFRPGIVEDESKPEGRRVNRGYLCYAFETETFHSYSRLLIVDNRGYRVRHPEEYIESDDARDVDFDAPAYGPEWRAAHAPAPGDRYRSFTAGHRPGDDNYTDPLMTGCKSICVLTRFDPYEGAANPAIKDRDARSWHLVAYTPIELADSQITQVARDLRRIGFIVGSIFALGFAALLAFLYFQLRYGEHAYAECKRRLGALWNRRKPAAA